MADISTTYMGLKLSSPVVVGGSGFSRKIDNIKKAEAAGAGGLVIYSLFQEQIEIEALKMQEELATASYSFPEALTYFPDVEHAGAREHIMWTEKARGEVRFPLIGSLNARSLGAWTEYAKQLESAGCDALEINLYSVETDPAVTASDIEQRSLDVISAVKSEVKIPVAVKLSPWYTSVANFVAKATQAGADGVVLFNRFFQPLINPDTEELQTSLDLSRPRDTRLPLRWIAILSGEVKADFAASTGVHSGKDVARHLLAGAKAAQCVSALYMNGIDYIGTMNRDISGWMDSKDYASVNAFRGKLNQKNISGDPFAFERAQYIRALMEWKK